MARTLLAIYPHSAHRYDEMLDTAGRVRAHWRKLFIHLDIVTPETMRQRLEFVDRTIQENGVTYNIYADTRHGHDRPWVLDPLPLILPADEWRVLSQAVAQRARLLNAILADLYGPQKLLAEGLLPPALVYGQHGFLWPAVGVRPPGDVFLHHYAVDLARSPDGRWWVIADRTQAPSGAGYALENRLIVARVFPDLFRDMKVQHLAAFFRDMQESLEYWAPTDPGERPRIVLLTPGPYNETYFEQAYLARYLGVPMVEGQDLTVRGDTVYLKTLTGLKRVHAILRRQDDGYCDPLELRGDSALGVPGLMLVARAGRVLIANALGSGLLGSAAMMGFFPAIARRLLDEDLLMPSVATWWCGEKPAQDFALAHLDELVIKPAYPTQRFEPIFGRDLCEAARADILRRIHARPQAYVAQELVNLSQGPVWSRDHERRLLARGIGLRLYATATPNGYRVMPGGLSRVAGNASASVISMQRGGASKDTWALSDEPVNAFSLLKPVLGKADLVRSGNNLSSRVVENLFWFGRYAARFDNIARLLRVALFRFLSAGAERPPELQAVLALCAHLGVLAAEDAPNDRQTPPADAKKTASPAVACPPDKTPPPDEMPFARTSARTTERCLLAAIFDAEAQGSLANAIQRLLWAATQVRERLSLDHWHSLNRLQHDLQARAKSGKPKRRDDAGEALAFLDQVLLISSSLTGFAMDNMTRDNGWRFLIIGTRIERLNFLADLLAHSLPRLARTNVHDMARDLEWLLELTDSIITYRSRYSRTPELFSALDLIVFDESNPHAVLFQTQIIQDYLTRLARELDEHPLPSLNEAAERLQGFDTDRLLFSPQDACDTLAACLSALTDAGCQLSDALGRRFFTHVDVTHRTLAV
jgi:uncharacterized circularly permuted ATP-grasp superfamily protein/uncharacterized alpha-E superfamily protein